MTAAHVVQGASDAGKAVGISGGADGHFVAVAGNWVRSAPRGSGGSDRYDLAVYRLPTEAVEKLSTARFLRLSDATFDDTGARAVYTLFGFPGVWSEPITEDIERLSVKPLEFTTYAYDGSVGAMNDCEAHLHLLLSGSSEDVTAPDGSPLEFRDRLGQLARLPVGLKGVSGCGVWHIGDLDVPIDRWGERDARVAGVLTGVYQAHGAIKATRWIAVTTLINQAFPELRPVLKLQLG
ncbi:MAG: hypothetical protein ACRDFA_07960 [bacterium]